MNDNKIKRCFEWAKEASEHSDFKQHHLGACLVYKGVLISKGYNSYKSAPVQKKYNRKREFDTEVYPCTLHAEIHCLSKANQLDIDFSKANLFVYRQYKNGNHAIAKPCPACMAYIKTIGIKNIYYTTNDGYAHEVIDYD